MISAILEKDLRRLRANWTGFVVLLAMPLCITALSGLFLERRRVRVTCPRSKWQSWMRIKACWAA